MLPPRTMKQITIHLHISLSNAFVIISVCILLLRIQEVSCTSISLLLEELSELCANAITTLMSSNTDMLGVFISGRQNVKTPLSDMASFTPSTIATYSASIVDNVTLCCVLETQGTNAPPNPITNASPNLVAAPETERLSAAFWA